MTYMITGGASGLGEESARLIHQFGGNVVILDLQKDTGNELVASLGERAIFVECNVAKEEDGKKAIEAAKKKFGGIHGLVNCAGIGMATKVVDKDKGPHKLSVFEKVIQVNLIGTFNMLRLVAQEMSNQSPYTEDGERGVIINVASVAAFEGQIGQAAYSASKGGIVAMTIPIARELSRYGIRVCTIAPGIFETPMTAIMPKKVREGLNKSIPFPSRLGTAKEFAQLALQIIENPYLNGETIRLDGAVRMSAM